MEEPDDAVATEPEEAVDDTPQPASAADAARVEHDEGESGEADSGEAQAEKGSADDESADDEPVEEVDYSGLELPDNLNETVLEGVREFASAHGLSAEVAQALLERESAEAEAEKQADAERIEGWKSDLENDLGSAWKRADAEATLAIETFGPEGFKELLVQSGFRYYGPLFNFVRAVGKAMSEPGHVVSGKTNLSRELTDEELWVKNFPKSGDAPEKRMAAAS